MKEKLLHRIIAAVIFLISAVQFLMTAQPSVSYWDPGELSAAAYALQIPHPPGGPLFLLVGRIFYMIPMPGDLGFRMNSLSALSSAFSVLFLYLVAVRLINIYKGRGPQNLLDALGTYLSAAVGALALSFCDTFWFNGVESNYFAAGTLLFSAITWLVLLWYEKAHQGGSWRYILLIAYLIGLSAGVHLMSVLSVFTVGMVVVFRRYIEDDLICKKSAYVFIGHAVILTVIALVMWGNQTSQQPPSFQECVAYDSNFRLILASLSVVYMGLFWKKVFSRNSFYLSIFCGIAALAIAYPGIIKLLPALLHSLSGDSSSTGVVIVILILALLGYLAYWGLRNKKIVLSIGALSIAFAVIGFTTYTMLIIRANQHPPMNENDPKSFSRLLTYLGREQYGYFPTFKRRWSGEARHASTWANYSSDLDFFWRYQIDHMFNRYISWNFIGKVSTEQDSGVRWGQLFGIPFFVGLFGLYHHFRKDWRMASAFLLMFIFMGYLTAYYQNQQEAQPRDRDYFYSGAYFVFSLWIALGIRGLLDIAEKKLSPSSKLSPTFIGILAAGMILIPGRMLQTNFASHDRSRNWFPWDFSYNMLQSCAPNAILFTGGDNDTFPLWYLQDVEGIRRDIRIVCLSLVNTEWYAKQLKHETPYGAARLKISLSDDAIDRLTPTRWEAKNISLPVPPDVIKAYGVTDSSVIKSGNMIFTMPPSFHQGKYGGIRVQDIMVREIVQQNVWQRPIYFASTSGPDSKIGLDEYLVIEGLAMRLVPRKKPPNQLYYSVNEPVLRKNLLEENPGFSKSYQGGFKFRGLDDSTVFFDDIQQMYSQNYRGGTFMQLASHYMFGVQDSAMCVKTLDRMEHVMPRNVIKIDYQMEYNLAVLYYRAGRKGRFDEIAKEVEEKALARIEENPEDLSSYNNPYRILTELYIQSGRYENAVSMLERVQAFYPNDASIKADIARYKSLERLSKDTLGAGKNNK